MRNSSDSARGGEGNRRFTRSWKKGVSKDRGGAGWGVIRGNIKNMGNYKEVSRGGIIKRVEEES